MSRHAAQVKREAPIQRGKGESIDERDENFGIEGRYTNQKMEKTFPNIDGEQMTERKKKWIKRR